MRPTAWNVLNELRRGTVLTIQTAMSLCSTSALAQRITEINNNPAIADVIISERVAGHRYHKYWIPGAIKNATKKIDKPIIVSSHTRKSKKSFSSHPTFDW